MTDLKKFCEYLYKSSYIPIYLYNNNNELTESYPMQETDTLPPSLYLSKLWEKDKKVTYTITSYYSYYGCVKVENSSSYVVIGPINDFPYSNDTLLSMSREFSIENSRREVFYGFFHNIPSLNLDTFINTLLFVYYTINNIELTRKDLENSEVGLFDRTINQKYSEKAYEEKEEGLLNNSYETERELIRYIETGNVEGIHKFLSQHRNVRVGTVASGNLRQWKNIFIVTATLSSRAAMKGGLLPSTAYQLSNIYMQQVERLSDLDTIQSLMIQVMMDYANRVANSLIPASADNILHQVVQYVRENTNKNITVTDVADHVGFTRQSLSRKFKKELGTEISVFIRKCKLEDAKDLLAFSDKSISEISNYLYFSSQSHFQKAFKDHFGITPQTYRKSTKQV